MFTKAFFYYDMDGNLRVKKVKGPHGDDYTSDPKLLLAEHAGAKCFELSTSDYCHAPAIFIRRVVANDKTDPWNEDGDPPSTLTLILYPHVYFLGNVLEITGFEVSNLCLAGHLLPPYPGRRSIKGADYLPPEQADAIRKRRHEFSICGNPAKGLMQKIRFCETGFYE